MNITNASTSFSGPHGNCNYKNKRFVQLISKSLWLDICKLFPDACPIVVNRGLIETCIECDDDMNRKISIASDLFAWAINTSQTLTSASEKNYFLKNSEENEFRLMCQNDIDAIDEIVDILQKAKKRGSETPATGAKLKSRILDILYRNMNIESEYLPTYVRKQMSFCCEKHLLPVASVESLSKLMASIPIEVQLVPSERYNVIHASLVELENILGDDIMPESFSALHPILIIQNTSNSITPNLHSLNDLVSSITPFQSDDVRVSWKQDACDDKSCYDEYLSKMVAVSITESTESNTTQSKDRNQNVINVEENAVLDDSNTILIEVHEFDGSKATDQCLSAIEMELFNTEINGSVRRSRRNNDRSKKVFSFHESKKSNLAQMRLRIYEKSENKHISNHQLAVFGFTEDSKVFYIELLPEWNERSIESILSDLPVSLLKESKLQVILNSLSSRDRSEFGAEENGECDDTVFDMLLQLATGDESPQVTKRGKRRREERGFSGTFLQSSFRISPISEPNENGVAEEWQQEKFPKEIKGDRKDQLIDLTCLSQDEEENKQESIALVDQVMQLNDHNKIPGNGSPSLAGMDFASVYARIYDCGFDTLKTLCPLQQSVGSNISMPQVPVWNSDVDDDVKQMLHDVQTSRSSNKSAEGDGGNTYFHLRHDRNLRNFYRNFIDEEMQDLSKTALKMTRREMDIILFYTLQKKSAQDCREFLIPYRTINALRHAFRVVKKQNFDDEKYNVYKDHVKKYVKELETQEQTIQLIDSAMTHG